jgi:site-specific DNA-methyltransferase (adenine-specific)
MKFDLLYVDPPWMFKDKCASGERGAGYKYSLLALKDLAALPVADIAAKNCALGLWVPNSMLPDGLWLMKEWSFNFKTVLFHWRKVTKADANKPAWGMGHWTRGNLELCLLGVRGRPKRASAGVHAEVSAERRTHSSKPVMVRKRLEILFGDVARCELFARAQAPGWRALGDEIDGKDIREALPALAREDEPDAAQSAI